MMAEARQEQTAVEDVFGPPISTYTRAQAIEDGVLVDVSDTAREAGIKCHTALTRAAWAEWVEVPPNKTNEGQSIRGRLWDVVWMARMCAVPTLIKKAAATGEPAECLYKFAYVSAKGRRVAVAKAHLGYGDNGESVLTIMQRDED
jgi:hypothetical protein